MLKPYLMDLHIHTCLSPCGESDMVPTRIVSRARQLGLDAIAVCDHNASENVLPVRAAGLAQGLAVFMGMEVTSREEIHVLALFGEDRGLELMQKLVESNLHGVNDEELFGPQYIVDERDYVSGVCERLLIGATDLSVEAVVEGIHRFGGLAVASHVDRGVYSVISQLGFIPPGLALDAIELSPEGAGDADAYRRYGYPLVTFSDAHRLSAMGRAKTVFFLRDVAFDELKRAFEGAGNRRIVFG